MFRFWILFAVIWAIGAAMVGYESIVNPRIRKAGYIFSSDLSKPPVFAEEDSAPYEEARERKAAKKMVEYEITMKDDSRKFAYFFDSAVTQEAAIKVFDAHGTAAEAKDAERIVAARWQNVLSALGAMTLPPLVILVMGLAIRWALKGFRRPDPA